MMGLQSREVPGQAWRWEEITRQLILMVFQSVCVCGGGHSFKEAAGPVTLAEL